MSKDPQTDKARMARQFIEMIPHARALNMSVEEIGDGLAVISMPYDEQLVGDTKTGVIHGGAVSALMDTCGGAAVVCHPDAPGGTATIDLRIDYMRAAKPGDRITARAECHHITRNVAFVRAVTEGAPVPGLRAQVPALPASLEAIDMRPKARRVTRGGYWTSVSRNARCANRSADAPGNRLADLGIRLVRSVD